MACFFCFSAEASVETAGVKSFLAVVHRLLVDGPNERGDALSDPERTSQLALPQRVHTSVGAALFFDTCQLHRAWAWNNVPDTGVEFFFFGHWKFLCIGKVLLEVLARPIESKCCRVYRK